jgi:hypothetical protein
MNTYIDTGMYIYTHIYMYRYMEIIIKGAIELNLNDKYIEFLNSIPRAPVPPMYLDYLARKNGNFLGFLFRNNLTSVLFSWSKLIYFFHYRGNSVFMYMYVSFCIYIYVYIII